MNINELNSLVCSWSSAGRTQRQLKKNKSIDKRLIQLCHKARMLMSCCEVAQDTLLNRTITIYTIL